MRLHDKNGDILLNSQSLCYNLVRDAEPPIQATTDSRGVVKVGVGCGNVVWIVPGASDLGDLTIEVVRARQLAECKAVAP